MTEISRCKGTHERMTPCLTSKSLEKEFHEKTKAMFKQEHAAAPGKPSLSVLEMLK